MLTCCSLSFTLTWSRWWRKGNHKLCAIIHSSGSRAGEGSGTPTVKWGRSSAAYVELSTPPEIIPHLMATAHILASRRFARPTHTISGAASTSHVLTNNLASITCTLEISTGHQLRGRSSCKMTSGSASAQGSCKYIYSVIFSTQSQKLRLCSLKNVKATEIEQ